MIKELKSKILLLLGKEKNDNVTELSNSQKEIIEDILQYIRDKKNVLRSHYLSVKTEDGQNKNNDIYDFIDAHSFNSKLLEVSVVILTANYYECEILNLNVFEIDTKKIKQLQDGLSLLNGRYVVKAYIMEINGYTVLHLHAPETGSNTPCGSSDLVRYVESCEFLAPSCIISFGICYGTDYINYSLGDTLIAKKVYPWSIGVKINDDGWNIKCDDYIINLKEENAILYSRIDQIIRSTDNLCPGQKAELVNMLTSEAVVSNEQIKIQAIQKAYGCNIVGGEMEGYGLAKECIYYGQTSCVIIKAICDWGAVKNIDKYISMSDLKNTYKDQIQAYTTYCAYKVLNELFTNRVFIDNNTVASAHEDLLNKYYSDGSIRKKVLDDSLEEYLLTNFRKYPQLSTECKNNVKSVLFNCIIDQYFKSDNKNECYIFKQLFF